jgi:hypothetical protein
MITMRSAPVDWESGRVDGVVRDDRQPVPDDGLLSGASFSLGDAMGGPSAMLSITRRLFPKKAPTHRHKTDTFRMALGEPIVVGRTSYAHGEFRMQQVDTYYGPEYWTDEVGTNQLLIMADRRGGKPYLTTPELQALSDLGRTAEEELGEGYRQHASDAAIHHVIADNIGAMLHAGHWNAGFTDTSSWPSLSDGTRLAVIAFGDPSNGPLLVCWDRPAGATPLPAFTMNTDFLRLVVDGSVSFGDRPAGRLAFRIQQSGSDHDASTVGPDGAKELWLIADRRDWRPELRDASAAQLSLVDEVAEQVDTVVASASSQPVHA